METLVLVAHVLLAIAVIALVLLQQGKGAEAGAAFGGGASQTVFGSQGTSSFLGRMTAVMAAGIFATSFVLAVFAKNKAESIGDAGIPAAEVIESSASQEPELPVLEQQAPAAPADSDVPTAE
ncbi:protein-export membrane protein SecG [Marinobacterium nitratireducens]|uniref:Protein-export membrane protein SecG n=1 Tax=Marinobacterium nitratireducens TaxID=518897 RepID=A0A917ZRM7_9GAMM|nr:preprotein translocase subunit SecG [Marinobacterium nitratireducens]GGO88632.1 protein-export membrane protein SecG [Marinobacterium nitratireducens]